MTPPKPAPSPLVFLALDPVLRVAAYHAPAWPTIGSGVMGSEAWDQLAAQVRADLPPEKRADFDAKAASMDPATKNVLGVIHKRQKHRTPNAGMTILLIVAIIGVVVIVARWWLASRQAATMPSAPTAPPMRPPWNPAEHGSLEQYLATHGHLPTPYAAPIRPAPFGPDGQPRQPWEPSA